MSYADDHKVHMRYELERQDKEWRALNIRERRQHEWFKTVMIALLTVTVALLLLWRIHP